MKLYGRHSFHLELNEQEECRTKIKKNDPGTKCEKKTENEKKTHRSL